MWLLPALARAVEHQLAGESATHAAQTLTSLTGVTADSCALSSGGPAHGVLAVLAVLTAVAAVVDGWTHGLAGVAAVLVVPVGGPAWAGLVPVPVAVAGVRAASRWARSRARGRVNPNVSVPLLPDHGGVLLTLLIVDDHAGYRDQAARALSRDGFEVVGTAGTVAEALASVTRLRPQVVLVDVHLGTESGFDLARRLAEEPDVRTVLMSTHDESDLVDLVAASPAAGFVPKDRLSGRVVRDLLGDG